MTPRQLLLPVGLVFALFGGIFAPSLGLRMAGPGTTFSIIAVMFLVNGYQTDLKTFSFNRRLLAAFFICTILTFAGGSSLGKLLVSLVSFDPYIATGIIIMCCMAPTLSSVVVITREAEGNTTWAVLLTVSLNLLSIFIIPVLLKFLLAGTAIYLPMLPLLKDLVLSVLLPFIVGLLLRRAIRKPPHPFINTLPTLLVILLSYMSFSGGRSAVIGSRAATLLVLVGASLTIHLLLFAVALALSRLARHRTDERKAVAFLSSQKTLPTAVGILASLSLTTTPAALPCVLFHFSQILCDSLIASFWARRTRK
jgi:sodium/bile acid cotransporter 7